MPDDLINVLVQNAPAVVMLSWLVWRQQILIEKFINQCIEHQRAEHTDSED